MMMPVVDGDLPGPGTEFSTLAIAELRASSRKKTPLERVGEY
jgi:hypothetical protein